MTFYVTVRHGLYVLTQDPDGSVYCPATYPEADAAKLAPRNHRNPTPPASRARGKFERAERMLEPG